MSWMVGKSGYTVPKDRLILGSRPNINIHTEKYYNNYGSGCAGGIFPMNYNMGYYGNMYGAGYYNPDPGLTKGEKWMLGLGAVTSAIGAVASAITGTKSSDVTETDTPETVTTIKTEQPEQTEQQIRAQKLHQKALEDNQRLKEEAKKLEELRQEGITKNTDGSFSAKIKDAAGNQVTLTNTSLDKLREEIKAKKEELSQVTSEEDPAELAKEGITKNPDGTYQAEITDKDGNKKTLKSNDLIDLRGQILLASQSDDNLIA